MPWAGLASRSPRSASSPALAQRTSLALVATLAATMILLALSYHGKERCTGPNYTDRGISEHQKPTSATWFMPCYSDVQNLWGNRELTIFPYLNGGLTADGRLYGGAVEYPVLTGLFMHAATVGDVHNDGDYLARTALMLAPFILLLAAILALTSRWWALLFGLSPPLLLYAFHNWDMLPVLTIVLAVAVVWWGERPSRTDPRKPRIPLRYTGAVAAFMLAIGFSLKIFPGLLELPLLLYVLTGGRERRVLHDFDALGSLKRFGDWTGALLVVVVSLVTVLAVQAPFAILGGASYRAGLRFQGRGPVNASTNSIYNWGLRPLLKVLGVDNPAQVVRDVYPFLVLIGILIPVAIGVQRWLRTGVYPWLGVSAAMVAAFMVLGRVNSPQYILWLLPFVIWLRVPWLPVVGIVAVNWMLDIQIFPYLFPIVRGDPPLSTAIIVVICVWLQALLLFAAIVWFPRARERRVMPAIPVAKPAEI